MKIMNMSSELATLISGGLTVVSTLGAVLYTNYLNNKNLIKQQIEFSKERIEENRQNKFVTLKHRLFLNTFNNLLDKLIVDNNYDRVMLFSNVDDGFEFYDCEEHRLQNQCRMFIIDNPSNNEVRDVEISTESNLKNKDSDKIINFKSNNIASLLRPKESIVLRLANDNQWENIIEFNENRISSEFNFSVTIKYTTEAKQRVTYTYELSILNDKKFEVVSDGISDVENIDNDLSLKSTTFRNLQNTISTIDRAEYIWTKQGQAQAKGLSELYVKQQGLTNSKHSKKK